MQHRSFRPAAADVAGHFASGCFDVNGISAVVSTVRHTKQPRFDHQAGIAEDNLVVVATSGQPVPRLSWVAM